MKAKGEVYRVAVHPSEPIADAWTDNLRETLKLTDKTGYTIKKFYRVIRVDGLHIIRWITVCRKPVL